MKIFCIYDSHWKYLFVIFEISIFSDHDFQKYFHFALDFCLGNFRMQIQIYVDAEEPGEAIALLFIGPGATETGIVPICLVDKSFVPFSLHMADSGWKLK